MKTDFPADDGTGEAAPRSPQPAIPTPDPNLPWGGGRRPKLMTAVAVYFGVIAISMLAAGGLTLSEGVGTSSAFLQGLGAVAVVVSVLAAATTVGLWRGRAWGAYAGIVIMGAHGLFQLSRLAGGRIASLPVLAVAAAVIWYLVRQRPQLVPSPDPLARPPSTASEEGGA